MLKNYLKIAWKVLLRRKFFTFVSLFGITFTLVVMTIVVAFVDRLWHPAGMGDKLERTLHVDQIEVKGNQSHIVSSPSYSFLDRYVSPLKLPEAISLHSNKRGTAIYVGDRKLELELKFVDDVFWQIVEFPFLAGRPFDSTATANADRVAIITELASREVFADPRAIGKYLETTSGNYRVIGIISEKEIPSHSTYADIYVPITTSESAMNWDEVYQNHIAYILAKDRSDFDAIKKEFAGRVEQAELDYTGTWDTINCRIGTPADLLTAEVLGTTSGQPNIIALGVIAILMTLFMLFPAINLINLNISRIIERSSEIGIRKAFGASSLTLVGQFLVENLLLTLIGGCLAYVLAAIILHLVLESGLIPFGYVGINFRVFLLSLLVCFFFGILSGVLPALKMARLHPVEALRGVES